MDQTYHSEHSTSERSGQAPRLTVIIVNYESWPDVMQLTRRWQIEPEFTSGRSGIVVVDNASRGSLPEGVLAAPGGSTSRVPTRQRGLCRRRECRVASRTKSLAVGT